MSLTFEHASEYFALLYDFCGWPNIISSSALTWSSLPFKKVVSMIYVIVVNKTETETEPNQFHCHVVSKVNVSGLKKTNGNFHHQKTVHIDHSNQLKVLC